MSGTDRTNQHCRWEFREYGDKPGFLSSFLCLEMGQAYAEFLRFHAGTNTVEIQPNFQCDGNGHFYGTLTSGSVNVTEMLSTLQARIAALEAKVG